MSKRLPVPAGLEHLLENREQDRRRAEQGKSSTAKPSPPAKERRKIDRRRKNA